MTKKEQFLKSGLYSITSKERVWWLPKKYDTPEQFHDDAYLGDIDEYEIEEEIRNIIERKLPKSFLMKYINSKDLDTNILNSKVIIKKIDALLLKHLREYSISLGDFYRLINTPFWEGVILGGGGDLDDGMLMATDQLWLKAGFIVIEHYHTGEAMFKADSTPDRELAQRIGEIFVSVLKKKDFQDELRTILGQIEYNLQNIKNYIIFLTAIESYNQTFFKRIAFPNTMERSDAIDFLRANINPRYTIIFN